MSKKIESTTLKDFLLLLLWRGKCRHGPKELVGMAPTYLSILRHIATADRTSTLALFHFHECALCSLSAVPSVQGAVFLCIRCILWLSHLSFMFQLKCHFLNQLFPYSLIRWCSLLDNLMTGKFIFNLWYDIFFIYLIHIYIWIHI